MSHGPPIRQCTLPSCTREATNPTTPGSLCGQHLDDTTDGEAFASSDGVDIDVSADEIAG